MVSRRGHKQERHPCNHAERITALRVANRDGIGFGGELSELVAGGDSVTI
jgi:hypothetical protein